MFKQGKGANIHVAVKIYAIAKLLQGNIAILMQHGGFDLRFSVGFIYRLYLLRRNFKSNKDNQRIEPVK